ncbi:branched-chain amino acid ABC transporter permease [Roseomonas haemaphysalidis]|uniref:branched-chain amino acid ABC transporter permease n=1 Tax=Roseomonas haemaphysalidis TaxID=2768162 RepID=UPI001A95E49C|nr:branched-chain amino acid ABC transporter permease [Roseomonas haemaphysalidis]
MFVESLLQAIAAGLTLGAFYGLTCVGLALIFGIMRVINFAQGDFMMVGMYLAVGLSALLAGLGVAAPFVAALLVAPLLFIAGALLHRFLVSRTTGLQSVGLSADGHQAQLILTLGIALVLQNGALILLGSAPVAVVSPLSSAAWELPLLYDDFSALFLNKARTIGALVSLGVALVLFRLIRSTHLGKSLRAAADNPEAATYQGIDVDRAHRIAFGLGTAIAGVAGGLIVLSYPVQPFVGTEFIIIMYAGVVLGGIGSITGAFWGGMVIGLVQQLAILVLPLQLQNTLVFLVFVLILLLRPQGLFGRSVERA